MTKRVSALVVPACLLLLGVGPEPAGDTPWSEVRRPGSEIAYGLNVPQGTVLLEYSDWIDDVVPDGPDPHDGLTMQADRLADQGRWRLALTGDPYAVARSLHREALAAGFRPTSPRVCGRPTRPVPQGPEDGAPVEHVPADHLECRYTAVEPTDRVCLDARWSVFPGRPVTMELGLDRCSRDMTAARRVVLPPGRSPIPPPPRPSIPRIGENMVPVRGDPGPVYVVLPGSRVLDEVNTPGWECSFGSSAALLEVTGDVERVLEGYARQAAGTTGTVTGPRRGTVDGITVVSYHIEEGFLEMLFGLRNPAHVDITAYSRGERTLLSILACAE